MTISTSRLEEEVPLFVEMPAVAGVVEALVVEDVLALALVETLHQAVAAHTDLSVLARLPALARLRIDHLVGDALQGLAEGAPQALGQVDIHAAVGVRAAGLGHSERVRAQLRILGPLGLRQEI